MLTQDRKLKIINSQSALLLNKLNNHFDMESTASICTKSLASAFQDLYKRRDEDDSTDLFVVCQEVGDDLLGFDKEIPVHSFVLATR